MAIAAALIAAVASLASIFLTWFLTERVRTEISAQTLALERVKVDLAAQALALDRTKTELAVAAQQTADSSSKIDRARLELERRSTEFSQRLGNRSLQVEDKKATTDEIRLTPDFAKLSNELRPALEIGCNAEILDKLTLKVDCSFKNKGAHRLTVTPTGASLQERSSQAGIPGGIASFENGDTNSILAGGSGSNTYVIRLTPAGASHSKPILRFTFRANTDQISLNMTKRLAKGVLTDDELSQLSVQIYTLNIWL